MIVVRLRDCTKRFLTNIIIPNKDYENNVFVLNFWLGNHLTITQLNNNQATIYMFWSKINHFANRNN